MPDWITHAIWWQVYPLGFTGAEPEAQPHTGITHRFNHLANWLDYALELGVSGIALGRSSPPQRMAMTPSIIFVSIPGSATMVISMHSSALLTAVACA